MKNIIYGTILLTIFSGFSIRCGDKCRVKRTYVTYQPIYSTTAEIKQATGLKDAQPLSSPGKIYLKDNILFVNEIGKGVHFYDNSKPASPQAMSFLNIPGNYDLAVLGNVLYADSYVDLVLFDISDINNVKEVNRLEGFFKNYNSMGFYADPVQGIVTSWEKTGTVSIDDNDCSPSSLQVWGGIYYDYGIALDVNYSANAQMQSGTASPTNLSTGISGSMSRFTVSNNFLYAIDGQIMAVVDINNPIQPQRMNDQTLLTWPETLFPQGNNLFVGSRAGMSIYDLATPDQPVLLSTYEHIYSCDPVIVQGNFAYMTLYNGDVCHMDTNELQLIDISDFKNPVLHTSYPMTNPHGLGMDQNLLFICDGSDGLKIFDASNPDQIDSHLLAHYPNINAIDIIPYQNIAMVIGSDGLYQYDYSNLKSVRMVSKIQIIK